MTQGCLTPRAGPLSLRLIVEISAFCSITSEDFEPLTQQIGLISQYKASLSFLDHGELFQYMSGATTPELGVFKALRALASIFYKSGLQLIT